MPVSTEGPFWQVEERHAPDQQSQRQLRPSPCAQWQHADAIQKSDAREHQEERSGEITVDSTAAVGVEQARHAHERENDGPHDEKITLGADDQ